MSTFDGDIYEKLFGRKNNSVSNSKNYANQIKEDLSGLYDNNYISPNGVTTKKNNGTTNGIMNGMNNGTNGTTNGMMNGMNNGTNGTTNGMTNGMNNGTNGTTNGMTNGMNNEQYTPLKPFPDETPLAMAYIPFQQWGETYEASVGFKKGTIFPDIDKPFVGKGAVGYGSK